MRLLGVLRSKKNDRPPVSRRAQPEAREAPAARDPEAIYQRGKPVARVLGAQVDANAKEIRFAEIFDSDDLLLPDECEFRNYRIIVQKVGFASRAIPGNVGKGRVLRDCIAEILEAGPGPRQASP